MLKNQRDTNQWDWYRLAMAGVFPITFMIFLYLLSCGLGGLILDNWFLDLFYIPAFIGAEMSSAAYIGRSIDATSRLQTNPRESIGMWIGLALGVAVGVAIGVVSEAIPFLKPLGAGARLIYPLVSIGIFAGLGNRLGQSIEKGEHRPKHEKIAIGVAAVVGIAGAIALVAANYSAVFALFSSIVVTTAFTAGAALPIWIAAAIFVCVFANSCASSTDYVAKTVSYGMAHSTQDPVIKNSVRTRYHEYRGSAVGVALGVIAAAIIVGLFMANPPMFLGVLGAVVLSVMIFSVCVSLFGGICSRVGRMMDLGKIKNRGLVPKEEEVELLEYKASSYSKVNAILDATPPLPNPLPHIEHGGEGISSSPSSKLFFNLEEGVGGRRQLSTAAADDVLTVIPPSPQLQLAP